MNKKGFTLVELLAVIVILGMILTIGLVSIKNVSRGAKEAQRKNLIAYLQVEAEKYHEKTGVTKVYVYDLINVGLVSADLDDHGNKVILNPVDNTSLNYYYFTFDGKTVINIPDIIPTNPDEPVHLIENVYQNNNWVTDLYMPYKGGYEKRWYTESITLSGTWYKDEDTCLLRETAAGITNHDCSYDSERYDYPTLGYTTYEAYKENGIDIYCNNEDACNWDWFFFTEDECLDASMSSSPVCYKHTLHVDNVYLKHTATDGLITETKVCLRSFNDKEYCLDASYWAEDDIDGSASIPRIKGEMELAFDEVVECDNTLWSDSIVCSTTMEELRGGTPTGNSFLYFVIEKGGRAAAVIAYGNGTYYECGSAYGHLSSCGPDW